MRAMTISTILLVLLVGPYAASAQANDPTNPPTFSPTRLPTRPSGAPLILSLTHAFRPHSCAVSFAGGTQCGLVGTARNSEQQCTFDIHRLATLSLTRRDGVTGPVPTNTSVYVARDGNQVFLFDLAIGASPIVPAGVTVHWDTGPTHDGSLWRICAVDTPTLGPTLLPTVFPTRRATTAPTRTPTSSPTSVPTALPTAAPSVSPSVSPSAAPSQAPFAEPTSQPSSAPTNLPSTLAPSESPTGNPTNSPSTVAPSETPTANPTSTPTPQPSAFPTAAPTAVPTMTTTSPTSPEPTESPTATPTLSPSFTTVSPTLVASAASGESSGGSNGSVFITVAISVCIGLCLGFTIGYRRHKSSKGQRRAEHHVGTGFINPTFIPTAETPTSVDDHFSVYEAPVTLNPTYTLRSKTHAATSPPSQDHHYTAINDLVLGSSSDAHYVSVSNIVPILADNDHSYSVFQPLTAPNTQYQLFQDLPSRITTGSSAKAYAVAVPQGGTTFMVPFDPAYSPVVSSEVVSDGYVEVSDSVL